MPDNFDFHGMPYFGLVAVIAIAVKVPADKGR